MPPLLGHLVDLQEDFMRAAAPGGRLYVRHLSDPDDAGAERIIPRVARVARWMAAECDVVIYTGDAHRLDDAEISGETPDFTSTYPVHCAAYSPDAAQRAGAALIPEVAPASGPLVLLRDASDADATALATRAVAQRVAVLVEKSRFSVWTGNAAMDALLAGIERSLGARPEVIVCGVATDVCVAQAVDGYLARGYAVTVVRDAIYSLDGNDEAWLARWAQRGARITTTDQLCGMAPTAASTSRAARSPLSTAPSR